VRRRRRRRKRRKAIRRLLFVVLLGVAIAVALKMLRQRPQARVDVYLADGSLTSLGNDAPEGALLLSLAREVRGA
jgi:hypothetical protein